MHEQLKGVENRFLELEKLLSDPSILQDREKYQNYSREHSDLSKVVAVLRTYEQTRQELDDSRELLKDPDPDIKEMARTELDALKSKKSRLEFDLKKLLLPKDPNDNKNVIVEIRAGTGGEEASLFVSDLFRMYSKYAENKNWKVEVMAPDLYVRRIQSK